MLLDKEENKREEGIVEYRDRVESVGVFIERVWGFILAIRIRNRGEVCVSHSESCEN
jgi:hypothetical protein